MVPLRAGDDARQKIVGKNPLGPFLAAVDREGDALVQEGKVGGMLAAPDFISRQRREHLQQWGIVRTRFARAFKRLVVRAIDEIVAQNRVIEAANFRQTHGEV